MKVLAFIIFFLVSSPAFSIVVTISATTDGSNKPVIIGTTNLPSGTKLMVTLSRKESSYSAQSKATVENGQFRAGPFSQSALGLNPGSYTIDIKSPLAILQPNSVQSMIGKDGTKMTGKFSVKSEFGGKQVSYSTIVQIGSGKSSAASDNVAREKAKKNSHLWWVESCRTTCNIVKAEANRRKELYSWSQCNNKCLLDEYKK